MKPKLLPLITVFICLTHSLFAQDFRNTFRELSAKGDSVATLKLLHTWQKTKPNDPEMYVAFYNYYALEGLKDVLSLQKEQPGGESFQLTDSTGKVAGYLGSQQALNINYLNHGFKYIDSAIDKFPTRLDMRFGKVYVLGRMEDYEKFTGEIIKTIKYGQSINFKWIWTDSKPLDDPEKFMLGTVQNYVIQLFNAGDKYVGYIGDIAQTVLKYKPDHVESLSNLSISYMIKKDYPHAIEGLLKAEKLAPQDYIVLNNIAYCYELQGNKPNAINYYKRVKQYGDDDAKVAADKKIQVLQKQ
jgi:tetratricopeptide (TPR) repeat protein